MPVGFCWCTFRCCWWESPTCIKNSQGAQFHHNPKFSLRADLKLPLSGLAPPVVRCWSACQAWIKLLAQRDDVSNRTCQIQPGRRSWDGAEWSSLITESIAQIDIGSFTYLHFVRRHVMNDTNLNYIHLSHCLDGVVKWSVVSPRTENDWLSSARKSEGNISAQASLAGS